MNPFGPLLLLLPMSLAFAPAEPVPQDETDFFGSVGAGEWQVGGIERVTRPAQPAKPVGWQPQAPVTIDDCSVFLATGSREEPRILDCVGAEIRAASFEMPPGNYFLVNAAGEVVDRAALPVVVTLAEFRALPIQGGQLVMQPAAQQVLINIETIAYSTARTHVLNTTILGTPVAVRATPIEWAWDFGGGTAPFVTTGPGGPYPDLDVSRVYRRVHRDLTIGLTITWAGEYRVNNAGPWLPIAGTTTTSASSAPFETVEAPARLVTGTLPEG